jgi:hypothetical protein
MPDPEEVALPRQEVGTKADDDDDIENRYLLESDGHSIGA